MPVDTNVDNANELSRRARNFGICTLVSSGIALALGAAIFVMKSTDKQPGLVVLLFLLPLLHLPTLIIFTDKNKKVNPTFYKFNAWATGICILFYSLLWIFYQLLPWWWLSIVALSFVATLVVFAFTMTAAIMMSPHPLNSTWWSNTFSNLRSGGKAQPWWTLSLSIILFLGVSYLLGFAFAFHDKAQPPNEPALYLRNLYKPPASMPTAAQPMSFSFQFVRARALMAHTGEAAPQDLTASEKKEWDESGGKNTDKLTALVNQIIEDTNDNRRVRVVVTGYADKMGYADSDNKNTKASYKSNYELAGARAQNAKALIENELISKLNTLPPEQRWRGVEWSYISKSNERPESEKVVEVSLEGMPQDPSSIMLPHLEADHPNKLDLMDYVYFANYTITTTGYGDIIPETPYAKFICSIANICEVLFLVVFINSLLSLKTDTVEDEMYKTNEEFRQLCIQVRNLGDIIERAMNEPEGNEAGRQD